MRRGMLTLCAVASLSFVSACGGGEDQGPSATLASARTTTTRSVEAEVEAAYLKSWDIYAEAVLTFDTSRLTEAYGGRALEIVSNEVNRLHDANTPLVVHVDHDLSVTVLGEADAAVKDEYVNRNYRVDGATREPIDDPNDPGTYVEVYALRRVGDSWVVIGIERQSHSSS